MKTQADIVRDLAMIVQRLAYACPARLRDPAIAYLEKYNLLGGPMRDAPTVEASKHGD